MNTNSVFDLSSAEKLQLVEDLWDDLSANPAEIPIHDWQIKELERRQQNLASHTVTAVAWDEVKARIRSRYGR